MIQGIYSGASGLKAQQQRLDVLANNVANVDTTGFKATRVDFQDALYQTMARPVQPQEGLNLQQGHGVHVSQTLRAFSQGMVQQTGRTLDVMVDGEGYFVLQSPTGEIAYTRDGSFNFSAEGGQSFLVAGDGSYVLDTAGNRIAAQGDESQWAIAAQGQISIGTQAPFAQLLVVRFPNQEGLSAMGNNRFVPTQASGAPQPMQQPSVIQGALEGSNVDLAQELTRLIRTQRAFTLSSRAVQTADEMEGIANGLRR